MSVFRYQIPFLVNQIAVSASVRAAAFGNHHVHAVKIYERGKREMAWSWQEQYNAALSEKNPEKSPERLVAAEKAILRRLQELPHSTDELPEAQALRQALDSLYALRPREHRPPGEIADEEPNGSRRKWTGLATAVALALLLSSAARWVISRRNSESGAAVDALRDAGALIHSRTATVIERGEKSALDALSREHAAAAAPGGPADLPLVLGNADPPLIGHSNAASHDEDAGGPTRTTAPPHAAEAARPAAPANVAPVSPVFPDDRVANPLPETPDLPESASTNAAVAPTEPKDLPPAPGNATRGESPLPEGSVSVTTSTYPSIRIPPELSSEGALSAASLQIGTAILRPDPVYPEEAKRQGVQGIAKLRVVIGKDGSVQDVQVLSGPPLLTSAGTSALRQWRYKPTFLGDQPVEVSEEVTIVFRLASATAAAN
jgi:periplasmic protein TonB